MASSIGIKLANGEFFPILDEVASTERDLELTTMRDDQESVQINLFRKSDETDPKYIGSLIVEEITKGLAGDPTINLKIKLDEEENLSAEAIDEVSGSKQSLKVSLKTLSEDEFDIPDFDLSGVEDDNVIGNDPNRENVLIPIADDDSFFELDDSFQDTENEGLSINEQDTTNDDAMENDQIETFDTSFTEDDHLKTSTEEALLEDYQERKRAMPLWLIILLILLCIGALVVAILLLTKKMPNFEKDKLAMENSAKVEKSEKSKSIEKTTSTVPKEDTTESTKLEAKKKAEEEAKRKSELEAAKKAEEEAKRKAEELAKKKTPKIGPDGTVRYKLKWGDTLWDLSETFYKTPWAYKKIARHNKIKNPNLIIAGTYIEIPSK